MNRRSFLKSLAGLAGVALGAKVMPALPEVAEVAKAVPIFATESCAGTAVPLPALMTLSDPELCIWDGRWSPLYPVSWINGARWDNYAAGRVFREAHGRAATQEEWEAYWYTGKLEPIA